MTDASVSARLSPVGRSWNPLVWIATAAYRLTSAPLTPVRVIFARAPRLVIAHLLLMGTAEYLLSLGRRERALVRVLGSRINGCPFCDDLETHLALSQGALAREDVDPLMDFRESGRFNEREKAVLAYVEEVDTSRTASEETFAALRKHLTEREIVEITWLNSVGNYLNLLARPLGLESEGLCVIPESLASETAS